MLGEPLSDGSAGSNQLVGPVGRVLQAFKEDEITRFVRGEVGDVP